MRGSARGLESDKPRSTEVVQVMQLSQYKSIYGFVDGGYTRNLSDEDYHGAPWPNPRNLIQHIVGNNAIRHVQYFDAEPENGVVNKDLEPYWNAIQRYANTSCAFGYLKRRKNKRPEQKAVDTLIATNMLVGAFHKQFDFAVLIAGDADFVPVVDEVQRMGVRVAIGAGSRAASELIDVADIFFKFPDQPNEKEWPAMKVEGHNQWPSGREFKKSAP